MCVSACLSVYVTQKVLNCMVLLLIQECLKYSSRVFMLMPLMIIGYCRVFQRVCQGCFMGVLNCYMGCSRKSFKGV